MVNSKGVVRFHILEPFSFNEKKKLKTAIADLMDEEGKVFGSLDYIFCNDEYLLEINQAYLKHDDLTDIITFDLSEQPEIVKGEIYISVERVLGREDDWEDDAACGEKSLWIFCVGRDPS